MGGNVFYRNQEKTTTTTTWNDRGVKDNVSGSFVYLLKLSLLTHFSVIRKDLQQEVDQLEQGKLTNGAFRKQKRKCIDNDKIQEDVLVVYPKTVDDLKELRDLAQDKGYEIMFHDSNYGANSCFKGKKYVLVNTDEFETRNRKTAAKKSPDTYATPQVELTDVEKYIKRNSETVQESFKNWEGSQNRKRVLASRPETLTQLQNLIRYARDQGLRIRCAGTKHSWAPLFADENQICIYLTSLNSDYPGGKKIRFSPGSKTEVDVMTGVNNGDLKAFQLENKVNLPCNVILTAVQPVSVVATGCHGVGWDCLSPGDYVTKMRIVDSFGELRTYTTDNMEQMKAIQANFGLFGVIFDMTIKMEKQHIAESQNLYRTVEQVFYDPNYLKQIVENNWSVEIFWFPFNSFPIISYDPKEEDVYMRIVNKTNKPGKLQPKSFYEDGARWDWLTQNSLVAGNHVLTEFIGITPFAQSSAFKLLKNQIYPEGTIYQELPHAVHFREYIDWAPVHDLEFVFDCKGDYEKTQRIIQIVIDKSREHFSRSHYPFNIALEMRWMAYSECYLCPAIIGNPALGGSGHVFYVEVLSVDGTNGWDEFCIELGIEWMKLGGMPHLAKEWDFIPGAYEHIRQVR
ncbi:hypothetical protein KUTeg_015759 [Tegillarca granosa]|uniref:FAD-binding PCMH-type domain-containing protein n=1 Tax=Tegillarca granosa TaxID=220873 RepID=A0ABQ9ETT6_TEGGR|nr:hypothetical protein KUTeg_015759 [Tegillarca granosa]